MATAHEEADEDAFVSCGGSDNAGEYLLVVLAE